MNPLEIVITGNTQDALAKISGLGGALNGLGDIVKTGVGVAFGGFLVEGINEAKNAVQELATKGIETTVHWGEEVHTLGSRLGLSAADGSMFAVAMEHVGVSVDEGSTGLNMFA